MIKRWSSKFGKDRKTEKRDTNGRVNGVKGRSESSNGSETSNEPPLNHGNLTNGNSHSAHRGSTFGFSKHEKVGDVERKDIDGLFQEFSQIIHASKRPIPNQNGDGTYNEHKEFTGLKEDLKALGIKDYRTLLEVIKGRVTGKLVDDKTMIMERLIQAVAGLPPMSKNRVELTNEFIGELWSTLSHPPQSYMGDEFMYRKADGSNNSIKYPHLGAANTPYARSCKPSIVPPGSLPDPGVIFDCVMKRYEYKPHPNGVSSILWYWASIIIHDCFRTDHQDFNNSLTSSYLDLSPLYGSNQTEQDGVRTFKDGKLKPDCFAERRLLGFPPGVGCLLIMFNRFHNHVADQLAIINEHGRFTRPTHGLTTEQREKSWAKYDNDLFQTARLITSGLYINITLTDYVRTIVGLNRTNSTWTLDPRAEMGKDSGTKDGVEWGTGNQVSAEFNLFYRWHSCISDRDDKWTQELYRKLWPGKDPHDITLPEMMAGLGKMEKSIPDDPVQRPFGGFTRGADGKLDDDELVKCLTEGIEDLAGAFGANNVPQCMKPIEILGIIQGRKWNVAGLNEFRKHFGLKPHDSFEDINSDQSVADHLRHLYGHPDFVELYPGLVAEEAKKPMTPGVGIAPTYTVSRVILSDAVCLVRGDRFYTVDYHPRNLTSWGFNEVQTDFSINQGCVFYKLFTRAFPNHFKGDSVYAHFPMTTPSVTKDILTDLKRASHFSYDRPARIPEKVNLVSYSAAKYVLERDDIYKATLGESSVRIMGEGASKFMLCGDGQLYAKQRQIMSKALYIDKWKVDVQQFYEYITQRLLFENTYQLAGVNQVDIIRDVGNIAPVHFAANVFSLPLKTTAHPHGIITEHEMYMILAIIYMGVCFDVDPMKSFPLRQASNAAAMKLGALIEANVKSVKATGLISGVVDKMAESHNPLKDYGVHMIRQLLATGLSIYDITWSQMLPVTGAMVASQAQVFAQSLDYYLGPGKKYLSEINQLAKANTPEADDILLHYAMEGIRLAGTFGLYRQAESADIVKDGDEEVQVKAGDSVFVSFVGAARDPVAFPNPEQVDITRPLERYIHYGGGPHTCLGKEISMTALTAMWKVVGRLDNLRRAPGPQGELKKIPRPGGFYTYMREDMGSYFPFPTTMKINWDGEVRKAVNPAAT